MRSLPAINSSDGVALPSVVIETQESSRAWMTTVNSPGVPAVAESFVGESGVPEFAVPEAAGDAPEPLTSPAAFGFAVVGLARSAVLPDPAPDPCDAGNGAAVVVGAG